jgi:hypothetical protein
VAAQREPGRLALSVAFGFAGLGTGRPVGCGAVGRGGGPQPVALLGGHAGVPDPVPFVVDAGPGPVLAGQHGDQVDVVGSVADRDPAHRVVFVPARAQPGAMHHILGYLRPFRVGQHPVLGGGAHRAMPDRLGVPPLAERVMREPQQADKAAEVPAAAGAQRGFQVRRRAVACDDVRVGVFFPASGAVQVPDQPGHVLAARAHLPDHRLTVPSTAPGRPDGHPRVPGHWECHRSIPGRAESGAECHPPRIGGHRVILGRRGDPGTGVRVDRGRGWPGGISSAGLPRPPPAGPRGGRSPGRMGQGPRTTARSRSASRRPG